ncbi:MAG: hypothetical protein AB1657_00340 [Candidatus Micrarchaeota archaeon]
MEGRLKCKCGNEIFIYSDVAGRDFEIRSEGGKIQKKKESLVVYCGKCGKEAGKVKFYRQVPAEKK